MAYFDPEHTDDALQSCAEILVELRRQRNDAPPHSPLRLLFSGVGLALGSVLEGTMGSSVKMDYTIIGEPVNTAARLEALTRTLDTPVLMTEAVKQATQQRWDIAYAGTFDTGRHENTQVYSLATELDTTAGMRATVERVLNDVASGRSR